MADIFREVDESLKEDRVRAFWARFGNLIIAGAIGAVVATSAYVFWQRWQTAEMEAESSRFAAAVDAAQADPTAGAEAFSTVVEEGGDLAVLALMYEAGLRADAGETTTAAFLYRRLADDEGASRIWRDLARLRAVMLEADEGEPGTLLAELDPLLQDDNPWRYSARELAGLLSLRAGDEDAARGYFEALVGDVQAPSGIRNRAAELTALLSG